MAGEDTNVLSRLFPGRSNTTMPLRAAGLLTRRATPRHGAEIAGSGAVGQETHRAKQQVAL
jgi:hypothetical protein